MHRRHIFFALTVAVLAVAATPAIAAKGGGGGKTQASISFASVDGRVSTDSPARGSTVWFSVESALASREFLAVTNRCWRNGAVVYNEYKAVADGTAGAFTMTIEGEGAAQCEAFVWSYPNTTTPLRGGSMTYEVS